MRILTVIVCVMAVANIASADIVQVQGINLDFVTIGNTGNAADTQVMNDGTTGYGAVGYEYQIGKYEVTCAQWDQFTTAAGAPTGNPINAYDQDATTEGGQPTDYVSWYEAAQFCNYLTSGDKSQGAYQIGTDGSITKDRGTAVSTYGIIYVIPTEDEWYKAAYYTGSGYSTYANGLDTIPPADDGWNYDGGLYDMPWNVGSGTQEQNGTYDMMGNLWEWNEDLFGFGAGARGGSFESYGLGDLASSGRASSYLYDESIGIGFRVASVPEPATLLLLGFGGLALRKRKH